VTAKQDIEGVVVVCACVSQCQSKYRQLPHVQTSLAPNLALDSALHLLFEKVKVLIMVEERAKTNRRTEEEKKMTKKSPLQRPVACSRWRPHCIAVARSKTEELTNTQKKQKQQHAALGQHHCGACGRPSTPQQKQSLTRDGYCVAMAPDEKASQQQHTAVTTPRQQ
jgi:hypothetical protein